MRIANVLWMLATACLLLPECVAYSYPLNLYPLWYAKQLSISHWETVQRQQREYEESTLKLKLEYGRKLRENFEEVFIDPNYLSAIRTPARDALIDHFLYHDQKVPSRAQFVRLVEAVKQKKDVGLIESLKEMWISRHATTAQRIEFAKAIDIPKHADRSRDWYLLPRLFWYLLPEDRMTDDDYRSLMGQVAPTSKAYAWAERMLEEREERRVERADDIERLKSRTRLDFSE